MVCITSIESVWASAKLNTSQKKATVNMMVCHGLAGDGKRMAEPKLRTDSAIPHELDALGCLLVLQAEAFRIRIAKFTGVPCATLHRAIGELKGADDNERRIIRDLNLLNHAYTGLHHFDAAKLEALSQQVDRLLARLSPSFAGAANSDASAENLDTSAENVDASFEASAENLDASAENFDTNAENFNASAENIDASEAKAENFDASVESFDTNADNFDTNAENLDANAETTDASVKP